MTGPKVIQPHGWLPPRGYSDGMITSGRVITIAGQIGWDPTTGKVVDASFTAQTAQALRNIVAVLAEAGAGPGHLVRLTWFVTDRGAYLDARRAIGDAYRDIIGRHYPPMSVVVVKALIEPEAMVEIEATAIIPD
ncbi:MAG: RidA family protein [Gemmatimonadaceae bacterium]